MLEKGIYENNKKLSIYIVIFSTVLILSGCKDKKSDTFRFEEDSTKGFSKFIAGISKFPYTASPDKSKNLISQYDKISIGMTKEEVLSVFPEPDAKENAFNEMKGHVFLYSSWSYYLHREEKELGNPKDKAIFINFDKNNKVYFLEVSNISELKEKGNPLNY